MPTTPSEREHQGRGTAVPRADLRTRGPFLASPHATLLIVSAGLLTAALFLEGVIPGQHEVGGVVDEHHLPGAVHGLAIISVLLSLWPALHEIWRAARIRRLHWQTVVVAGVLTTLAMGQVMAGAVSAWLLSLGSLVWRHLTGSDRRGGAARS